MHPHLWAVTSLYNPSKSKARIDNYREFCRHLKVKLVTVELSFDGQFELTKADADILIQISKGAKIWQKERLLNRAIEALPADVTEVVWIDADIIFENDDWADSVHEALQNFTLVQCFSEVIDLPFGYQKGDDLNISPENTRKSFAYMANVNEQNAFSLKPNIIHTGSVARGFAWAAKRAFIQKQKLYDACITGSGDRALAFAAFNRPQPVVKSLSMNTLRTNHYLNWATEFSKELSGSISYIDGRIFHLWHGNLGDRGYSTRHQLFSDLPFDPMTDLILNSEGAWDLETKNLDLIQYFEVFFSSRKENLK